MRKPDAKSVSIAVGQAINILASRNIAPTEANIEGVVKWAEFILECQEKALFKFYPELNINKEQNNQPIGDDL